MLAKSCAVNSLQWLFEVVIQPFMKENVIYNRSYWTVFNSKKKSCKNQRLKVVPLSFPPMKETLSLKPCSYLLLTPQNSQQIICKSWLPCKTFKGNTELFMSKIPLHKSCTYRKYLAGHVQCINEIIIGMHVFVEEIYDPTSVCSPIAWIFF